MRIGVDLGGTKIEAIALADDGRELARIRIPSPRGNYADTLTAVAGLVATIERETGQSGTVGVGIPGTLSPATGLVKNANSTWLIGQPFGEDLRRLLGRPVRFANDANCFALSEAVDGAAADARVVFGVIIGTGVGGGIVVDRRVLVGKNAIAGEWGHNPLPPPIEGVETDLPGCYCGRRACIEAYLSGPAFARDPDIERYAARMGRALAAVINILDPDVIVLGGGMSNMEALYSKVPREWTPYVFSDRVDTPLLRARHGDSSGVRGAAWLWEI